MAGLTKNQSALLSFITRFTAQNGFSPSYVEMAVKLGMSRKSKANVKRALDCLERRGYIRRIPQAARSIELINIACPHCGGALQ